MKKFLALLLAMMMVLALCACGSEEAAETAAPAAAGDAAAPAGEAAPEGEEPPEAPEGEGEASGDASGEAQTKELFSADGYDKTFDGYKAYVTDAMSQDESNPFLADELATIAETTEDTFDPTGNPWAMQVEFGLILSYEDFLAA